MNKYFREFKGQSWYIRHSIEAKRTKQVTLLKSKVYVLIELTEQFPTRLVVLFDVFFSAKNVEIIIKLNLPGKAEPIGSRAIRQKHRNHFILVPYGIFSLWIVLILYTIVFRIKFHEQTYGYGLNPSRFFGGKSILFSI